MDKHIYKVVLTGGPAAGKTTLISRIMKEFKQEDGWRVITIPETATELISGFGIKPFGNCMSMLEFQDFVIVDQVHKEKLALQAAQVVADENILILYDRALMDDKAYIPDEEFSRVLFRLTGKTEGEILAGYDAVIHMVTCAKGAEEAYNLGNAARTESIAEARAMDDRTLRAWSGHRNLKIIDNSVDFEDKINRGLKAILQVVGMKGPEEHKSKFLVEMPDLETLTTKYRARPADMMQTYLIMSRPENHRRVRQEKNGSEYMYFYTEKKTLPDGTEINTERPISEKQYIRYLMEGDPELYPVHKTKYRFSYGKCTYGLDVYPFSAERAILFRYGEKDCDELPPDITVIREVTGEPGYKNLQLAKEQRL